jgi:hypothetical protein
VIETGKCFTFVKHFKHLPMNDTFIAGLSAFAGVISYTVYSKYYDPLVEKANAPLLCATSLYGISAAILLVFSLVFLCFTGWDFEIKSTIELWNGEHSDYKFIVLFVTVLAMALLYTTHIIFEAKSRQDYSIATYAILFQANVVFIVLFSALLSGTDLNKYQIIGGCLVITASVAAFINSNGIPSRKDFKVARIALISAATCGCALVIDGEMCNNIILKQTKITTPAPFLFYEMLTFGIPALFAFVLVCFRYGKTAFQELSAIYLCYEKDFWIAALGSVLQFVFAVFALSFEDHRILVASILGTAPLLGVISDTKPLIAKSVKQKINDIISAIITLFGVILCLI